MSGFCDRLLDIEPPGRSPPGPFSRLPKPSGPLLLVVEDKPPRLPKADELPNPPRVLEFPNGGRFEVVELAPPPNADEPPIPNDDDEKGSGYKRKQKLK